MLDGTEQTRWLRSRRVPGDQLDISLGRIQHQYRAVYNEPFGSCSRDSSCIRNVVRVEGDLTTDMACSRASVTCWVTRVLNALRFSWTISLLLPLMVRNPL